MTYAFQNKLPNGLCTVTVYRKSKNTIAIETDEPLTDDQMEDIYHCVLGMHNTGKRLDDLIRIWRDENKDTLNEPVHCKDCKYSKFLYKDNEGKIILKCYEQYDRIGISINDKTPNDFCSRGKLKGDEDESD